MKPLLAHAYEPHRVTYPCFVQPKLNGIRALYQNGLFQSRDEIPFPVGLLEHLAVPLRELFDERTILDGELYVHGWPLQRINAAVTPVRKEPTEDTRIVEYHVFDFVDYEAGFGSRTLTRLPFFNTANSPVYVHAVPTAIVYDEIQANELYAQFVSDGYEGMMYRLGDCPYTVPKQRWTIPWTSTIAKPRTGFLSDQDNRCWHLLKRKSWCDDEFEIVGVTEGEGKYVGTLGAIVCKTKHAKIIGGAVAVEETTFSVGSGFSDSDRDRYWNSWPLGRKAKVKYLCLSSDGIPLNPTLLTIL